MLKEYIKSKANKELKLTRLFADNKFVYSLGVFILVFTTLILNIGILSFNSIFEIINTGNVSIGLLDIVIPKFDFTIIYIIVYIIVILAYIKFVFKVKASYRDIKDGQKGTSRWTTMEELIRQYKRIPERENSFEGYGGIPVSREGNYIYIDDDNVNNMIVGISRSGKGQIFVLPMIDNISRANKKASMVIADPKGELTKFGYRLLKKRGYEVKVINLMDLDNTTCYNPLYLIIKAYKEGDMGEAQLLCKSLTYSLYHNPESKEPMWQNSAMSLVNALILAVCEKCLTKNEDLVGKSEKEIDEIEKEEKKVTLYTVATLLSDLGSTNTPAGNALDLYFDSLPKESIAKLQYATSKFSEGKTRASIFTVAMDKLQIYTFEKVAKFTSKNEINIKDIGFGEKPVALFLIFPEFDKSLHELNTILCNQIYHVLAKEASLSIKDECDRKVKFILDEFGNIPNFDNIDGAFTMGLGKNIEYTIFIQSLKQLKAKYGEEKAEIIFDGCGNRILLATGGVDTAEEFSKLLGEETITSNSRSGGLFSIDKQQTESVVGRRLLFASELKSLKIGEFVLIRTMKRLDLEGNKIEPTPIYTRGENSMKFTHEYLKGVFDTGLTLKDIDIGSEHTKVNLAELRIDLEEEIEELMHINYVKKIEENVKYEEIHRAIQARLENESNRRKESNIKEEVNTIEENKNEDSLTTDKYISKIRNSVVIKKILNKDQLNILTLCSDINNMREWIDSEIKNEDIKVKLIQEIENIFSK